MSQPRDNEWTPQAPLTPPPARKTWHAPELRTYSIAEARADTGFDDDGDGAWLPS